MKREQSRGQRDENNVCVWLCVVVCSNDKKAKHTRVCSYLGVCVFVREVTVYSRLPERVYRRL